MHPQGRIRSLLNSEKKASHAIKDFLRDSELELRKAHQGEPRGFPICKAYSRIVDDAIGALFEVKAKGLSCTQDLSLIAVGGYGRAELNIRSDIDMLLIHRGRVTQTIEDLTQEMLYILWDTGLDLGFSLRTIDECLSLAKDDLKTMTSLLDVRHISGSTRIFSDLAIGIKKSLLNKKRAGEIIRDKIEESRVRRLKYGGSVYILEPNIKEGQGGLRDFHAAMWVAKAKSGTLDGEGLKTMTDAERDALLSSLDFLLWVRNDLHFEAGRKIDQLTFEHQERIAGALGFAGTEHTLAVEQFMQRYYMHATNILGYSDIIISRCLDSDKKESHWPRRRITVDKAFDVSGAVLIVTDEEAFDADPASPMRAFEHMQANNVRLDQGLKERILNLNEDSILRLRSSKEASESFLRILKAANVYETLAEMSSLRLLSAFIPEFNEINCKVQHDLYHIYTVDVHTLFAVREIERLRSGLKTEFPIHSTILEELKRPELLMLSALLHDIGKGRGKGHALKGASMALAIARRLGLSEDDSELVEFLVRNHLILADTAQYRDLHDEKLVIDFAKKVSDIERLNLLYLLTFADVRAVGPDVWTQWKGALFQELFFKAITVLERGSFELTEAEPRIARIRKGVTAILRPKGFDEEDIEDYFGLLPQRYFLSNADEVIAGHILLLKSFHNRPYVMSVRQDALRNYTEIIVCTHDVHGLFSMITGVMASNAVDILGAQINTLKNGIVLDILQVVSQTGALLTDEAKLKRIEENLSDVITGKTDVQSLVGRRRPSILDKRPRPKVRTSVEIDNEVSDIYTVIDIHAQNRIGLLYDITRTLSRLGLYIYISKISTKGDDAADIFYVKDIFGQKVYYKERLRAVKEGLIDAVEGAGEEAVHERKTS